MKHIITTVFICTLIPILAFGQLENKRARGSRVEGGNAPSAKAASKRIAATSAPIRSLSAPSPMRKSSISVSGISHFSFQEQYLYGLTYYESFPVTLGNGDLIVVWASCYRDSLYSVKSTDNGVTWSSPSFVNQTTYCTDLCGVRTVGGRIVAVWQDNFSGLTSCCSDNNGTSWSSPAAVTDETNDSFTTLTQTLDGKLWLFYGRNNTGTGQDVYYRTSSDSGGTWSTEHAFLTTSASEYYATVVSKDSSTLLAIYEDNSSGNYGFHIKSSTNGGTTWSVPAPLVSSSAEEERPRVLRQNDGTLWLIYQYYANTTGGHTQSDIYYTKSTDGGNVWSPPVRWTIYAGYDGWFNACMKNTMPFVTFASSRWTAYEGQLHLWRGFIGAATDAYPPPTLIATSWSLPSAGVPLNIRAYVADDAGISSVQLSFLVNGVTYEPVAMYDDGLHNDSAAGDNIWGVSIGPFQLGDHIGLVLHESDPHLNTVSQTLSSLILISPIHTVGNIVLRLGENSQLSDQGASAGLCAYWPKAEGNDYLYDGGFWATCRVGGQNLVMKQQYGTSDWTRTEGAPYAMSPGKSDQDGDITYDDQFSSGPAIGLQVRQQSYQWSAAGRDDFIIFRYTVKNRTSDSLKNIYVSIWLDADVSVASGSMNNLGGYDEERHLAYEYNAEASPNGYLGTKLLGTTHTPQALYIGQYSPVYTNDDSTYAMITAGRKVVPVLSGDERMLLTALPFSLATGDSTTVSFGIVLGDGLAGVQLNTDSMDAVYEEVFAPGSTYPEFFCSRSDIRFGNVYSGLSKKDSIFVKNTGSKPLHIDSIQTMTDFFAVSPKESRAIAAHDSGAYVVTFSPGAGGSKKDTLWVFDNAAGSPHKISLSGNGLVTGLDHQERSVPAEFTIKQNYPNPFNPETAINFELSEASVVKMIVTDVLGRQIATLVDETLPAGYHAARWKGSNAAGQKVASGIYFCRMTADGSSGKRYVRTLKMALAK